MRLCGYGLTAGSWVMHYGSWVTFYVGHWVVGHCQWPTACSGDLDRVWSIVSRWISMPNISVRCQLQSS